VAAQAGAVIDAGRTEAVPHQTQQGVHPAGRAHTPTSPAGLTLLQGGSGAGPTPTRAAPTPADRERLVLEHLWLVHHIAWTMMHHIGHQPLIEIGDLIGCGTIGLLQAVDTFNPEYGVPFAAWARLRIRAAIYEELRLLDPLPRGWRARGRAIDEARATLAARHGRWPTDAEVATHLGITPREVRAVTELIERRVVSVDEALRAGVAGEPGDSYADRLADEDPAVDPEAVLEQKATGALVRELVERLPPRDGAVVRRHYFEGQELSRIAAEFGISQCRVSQLHARALAALRERLKRAI
jgi:RNA polymerase sigma factor for flagellar operon FliA